MSLSTSTLSSTSHLASADGFFALAQAVGPKAETTTSPAPTTAQPAAPAPASAPPPPPSMWIMLAPLLVVMVFMLFTSRSQKKREAETRAKLKKGDRIVTNSGIVGELVDMADGLAKIKVAPGTNIQVLLNTVTPYDPTAAAGAKDSTKDLKDLKDAKAAEAKK